jgi:hypothetical protein
MARMPRELDAAQNPAGHAGYVRYRNAHDVCARATLSPLLARLCRRRAAAPPPRPAEASPAATPRGNGAGARVGALPEVVGALAGREEWLWVACLKFALLPGDAATPRTL